MNVDKFLSNPNYFACNCSNLLYFEKNHGHIVTGDVQINKSNDWTPINICDTEKSLMNA